MISTFISVGHKRTYPTFHKGFGEYLKRIRGDLKGGRIRRWQHTNSTPARLSSSTISLDEQGKTKDIPAWRLHRYALIYKVPYEEVVAEWVKDKYGVDLRVERHVTTRELYPDRHHASLHEKLQQILESGDDKCVVPVEGVLEGFNWLSSRSAKAENAAPYEAESASVPTAAELPKEETYESHDGRSHPRLPYFERRHPAGNPADETPDGFYDLRGALRHITRSRCYVVKVSGDDMSPRIQDGDFLLVETNVATTPGQVVVASVNGAVTVRELVKKGDGWILNPWNQPKHKPRLIKKTDEFTIRGAVIRIVEGKL